ncbi:MAG TPA: HAD-IC family P-type ATPase [Candidatus Dormibacteraeota bacterium]|nr:HAD-IC family P-type ATPase [Candidatus Dormibacteraeota bacterium]
MHSPEATDAATGLTAARAQELLQRYGRNTIALERPHPLLSWLRKLWGPVPWLLEAVVVLTIATRRDADALAIAFLLLFNATLAQLQEGRAQRAVELLRKAIVVQSKVLRDGIWQTMAAAELVPGDVIHLGLGDVVPADARLLRGSVEVDQSAITGESLPRDVEVGGVAYASSLVKRGDALAAVTATGSQTTYGKTAELVRAAKATGSLERLVLRLVRTLTTITLTVIAAVVVQAARLHLAPLDVALFAIILLLASVPVAFPAAFTLATTLGSLELARHGVLVTRLTSIEDAASMDVLFTDKTGTITKNAIAVAEVVPFAPYAVEDVLALAAAASDASGQDPIDLAVLHEARARKIDTSALAAHAFEPFDPATKRSSASVRWRGGDGVAYKGAPPVLEALCANAPPGLARELTRLASAGYRVIAVACGPDGAVEPVGMIALADPPREDAAALVRTIRALGVRMALLTGDGIETAKHVAQTVGIEGSACDHDAIVRDPSLVDRCAVFASIFPDDKLSILRHAQQAGHVVGMTGDGVNDAPALKQANIGIAVSTATDVAKASASVILTQAGLTNIVPAIEVSRRIFQRMLTYTIVKIVKFFEITFVLGLAFFLTGRFLLTAELMVALLLFNDFVTLSIATDRVSFSHGFDTWRVDRVVRAAVLVAVLTAGTVLGIVWYAARYAALDPAQLQTLTFYAIAVMGQLSLLAVRERGAVFARAPSGWLLASTGAAIAAAALIALRGLISAPLSPQLVLDASAALAACAGALLLIKIPIFRGAEL